MSFRPAARQFFERRGAPTPPLPYDAEVEYLQSQGSQWIDTGYYATGETKIEVIFAGLQTSNKAVFGASNGNSFSGGELALFWNGSLFDPVYPTGSNTSNVLYPRPSYSADTKYTVAFDKSSIVINGSSQSVTGWSTEYAGTRTMYIFATHRQAGAIVPSQMKLYSFKMTNAGSAVIDMIPVRFTNELGVSEGAMYDRVSGALFRNAGTGAFTIGPDK